MEDIYISKKRQNANDLEIVNFDLPPAPPQQQPPEKKKKKKKHGFLKTLAVILLTVFLFTSVFIFVFAAASGYTKNDLEKQIC